MKKIFLFALSLLIVGYLFIYLFGNERTSMVDQDYIYTYDDAVANGDLIQKGETIYNVKKMDWFMKQFKHKKAAHLRISKFIKDDKVVIIDLDYYPKSKEKPISYKVNLAKFDNLGEPTTSNTDCEKVTTEKVYSSIKYIVTGCKAPIKQLELIGVNK